MKLIGVVKLDAPMRRSAPIGRTPCVEQISHVGCDADGNIYGLVYRVVAYDLRRDAEPPTVKNGLVRWQRIELPIEEVAEKWP